MNLKNQITPFVPSAGLPSTKAARINALAAPLLALAFLLTGAKTSQALTLQNSKSAQTIISARANLYPLHAKDPKDLLNPLFVLKNTKTVTPQNELIQIEYKTPDGQSALVETVTYEKGRVTHYSFNSVQTGETAKIIFGDIAADLTYQKGEKIKNKSFKNLSNFILAPIVSFKIYEFWDDILNGKPLKLSLIVPDYQDYFTFIISKEKDILYGKKPAIQMIMAPESMLVGLTVKPLTYIFEKEGLHRLLEIRGRAIPKRKSSSGSWEEFETRMEFEYPKN